jgi:hypothetical protein
MIRSYFTLAAFASLGLCIIAAYLAAGLQAFDNEFGPQGIHNLPMPPGSYRLNFMWYIVIALALLPLAWTVVATLSRRRRRILPGNCAHCGYNLTGNTSGVCPECGTPIQSHRGRMSA